MLKSKKTLQNIVPYSIDKYYTDWELKLDSNENPYGPSPDVINAVRNFDPAKIKYYPAYGALIDRLAELTGANPSDFILTNGCDEAINLILNAYLCRGNEVLSFAPTFSMPKLYCEVIGAKFVEIPYKTGWNFDFDEYTSNINSKTKILYLTSPNNPTGGIIPPETVEKLAKLNPNRLIILDCTYLGYSSLPRDAYYSLVKKYRNIAILKSFSKDYALAGFRLGYIFADGAVIKEINKIISPYSVNSAALCAGLAALFDTDYFLEVKQKINLSKNRLTEGIRELGFKAENTEANFILADFGEKSGFIYRKLLLNKIKVKYFKNSFFRITAPRLEDTEKFLKLLVPRPLFVFDLDGVVFDVQNSYRLAIKKTFEKFTKKTLLDEEIQAVKNKGGMSNDWDVSEYLIKQTGICVDYDKIVDTFQELFYKPGIGGLIDNERLVFGADFFEKLTQIADCAVFTGRPEKEAFYSLEKYGIKKYFSYFVCNEDVEGHHKPSPFGLNKIKAACVYSDIYYFGDTVDDIKSGIDAGVKVFGIIPPGAFSIDDTKRELEIKGACGVFDNPELILKKFLGDILCR